MARKRSRHGLGELQAEVMEMVWDMGEATVTQIHERIGLGRRIMYTTVQVAMQKLAKSGWLKPRISWTTTGARLPIQSVWVGCSSNSGSPKPRAPRLGSGGMSHRATSRDSPKATGSRSGSTRRPK